MNYLISVFFTEDNGNLIRFLRFKGLRGFFLSFVCCICIHLDALVFVECFIAIHFDTLYKMKQISAHGTHIAHIF